MLKTTSEVEIAIRNDIFCRNPLWCVCICMISTHKFLYRHIQIVVSIYSLGLQLCGTRPFASTHGPMHPLSGQRHESAKRLSYFDLAIGAPWPTFAHFNLLEMTDIFLKDTKLYWNGNAQRMAFPKRCASCWILDWMIETKRNTFSFESLESKKTPQINRLGPRASRACRLRACPAPSPSEIFHSLICSMKPWPSWPSWPRPWKAGQVIQVIHLWIAPGLFEKLRKWKGFVRFRITYVTYMFRWELSLALQLKMLKAKVKDVKDYN